jgi:hypothetical protein
MKAKSILILFIYMLLVCSGSLIAQWQPTEIPPNDGFCFASLGNNIYAGDFHNIYMSTNNGTNWTSVLSNSGLFTTFSLDVRGADINAAVYGGGIFRSTNNGTNWITLNNGLPATPYVVSVVVKDSFMFAGTGNGAGVFVSSDYGANWTLSAGSPANVYSFLVRGAKVLAGSTCGAYVSTNNGVNWVLSSNGLPSCTNVRALTVVDSTIYAGLVGGGGVYLSTDNGATWSAANTGISSYNVGGVTGIGSNIFAGTTSAGVFMSTNSGVTWSSINSGLPGAGFAYVKIVGSYLFAGSGIDQGVWRRPLSELLTGVELGNSEAPTGFELKQNYPNPFNPTTVINYSMPKASFISLKIYDILGREVRTLFSGYKNSGNYSEVFDASSLSSGIYYCKMTAGEFTDTKSMMLLK